MPHKPDDSQTTVLVPCKRCSVPVAILLMFHLQNANHGVICESCSAADEVIARREAATQRIEDAWKKICPPQYQATRFEMLPLPKKSLEAMQWPHGAADGHGLNLYGDPDTGKSRTLLLILQREHFKGKTVKFLAPGDFARGIETRAYKTAPWLSGLCAVDILAFDDYSRDSLTRNGEKFLFSVIEKRTSHNKPVFYSHNFIGAELAYRFKIGEPLVRRIRDFSVSIRFVKPQQP